MSETSRVQLDVIRRVLDVLDQAGGVRAWLFGGWGLDARIGRATRDHNDIEFWVERCDGDRVRAALVSSGIVALPTQPPEESCEFDADGILFSTAFFDRQPDGTFGTRGRWSDWVFPQGSFDAPAGHLEGASVPAMSVEGMLAMKEQFPTLRNGRPWRDKDVRDMEMLKRLTQSV